MKNKIFFSAFIGILALLGISLDVTKISNQELIIHFSDSESAESTSQETIALITHELQSIAVDHLKIEMLLNGALKVTYYSNVNAVLIKQQLSEAIGANFRETLDTSGIGNNKLPFEKNEDTYSIDINTTQDVNDLDDHSTNIVESKLENPRSSNLKMYSSFHKNKQLVQNLIEQVAYLKQAYNALLIDEVSYQIPEVRAGPYTS